MSFFKRLFGGGGESSPAGPIAETEHDGYHIAVTPQKEGEQYRLCGVISKDVGGTVKTHQLVRADIFPSAEDSVEPTLRKAKQIIAEQGDKMFADSGGGW